MTGITGSILRLSCLIVLLLGTTVAPAQTIDAVYFGQTHVLKASDSYFGLAGNRETLIKVHVTAPGSPNSPAVTATLSLTGQPPLVLTLTGPATLPASITDGPGVVQHSFHNTFTGYIPAAWVKTGLQVTVNAGSASTTITNMKVGAPTKVIMTMLDIHYFSRTTGDYPANSFAEIEAKWPVQELEVRRLRDIVFPELVIPPRPDVGAKAYRIKSKTEYEVLTGLSFDGEQAAALEWNGALKRAAGRSGRWSLYYMNIYNANAGGQAGGFAGVGNGTSVGILHHELGHALSLPHWGDSAAYPYKGDMHGIPAPSNYNGTHAGPAWAFDLRTKPGAFIPPTVQSNNVGGKPAGTYKVDPMQGGGTGYQEPGYLMNHFSDYSVNQMRNYLHGHVVVWNPALGSNGSWASWNSTAGAYTTTVSNNGIQFPTTRDTQVISILASMSGAKPDVNMVYPPIGPYTSGLIRLFDATVAADRTAANSLFNLSQNCDYCVRVVQGGATKTYILPASALTSPAQTDPASLETEAINLPASGGAVTKIELLSTPNVEDVGLPANPTVLYTWAPVTPDPAGFGSPPVANSSSAITMTALPGLTSDSSLGPVEYLFTETSGNPGGTSSSWQTSRSYTDTGLQPGLTYSYTVTMRAGTFTGSPSAEASATPPAPAATQTITVDSNRQFSLQSGSGLKNVTGLGTFDAAGADKLVVVISTEDANNNGIGYVYDVRYNGKVMTEAIQEDGGAKNGTAAIFYLDNPGAIGSGTIQVSAENPNGGIGCAYALSNTKPGFGASNSRTGSSITSVALTTSAEKSLVIAVMDNAGNPNSAGTPTISSPFTSGSSGAWGNQWGGHASGYRIVSSPASTTAAFTINAGSGSTINFAAAEFLAAEVPASVWTQTAGGSQNWTTGANWSGGAVPNPASGSTMDFSTVNLGANTTLNLGANRTAQLWRFGDTSGSQNWIVNGGFSMTLAGSTSAIEVKRNTTRLDGVVEGTAGLAKIGAGTLLLNAANTYTGTTNLNAGTLQIGNGGTTGSLAPASAIVNNSVLVFNRSDTLTQGTDFASVISGSGTLTKNGSGTLILGGDNTYTGHTTISAGTLQIGNGGTTGRLAVTSAITNNAALVFNRSNGVVQGSGFAGTISGTGSLSNIGIGTLTLNEANTYAGPTTISAGAIKVLHANALGTAATGTVVNGTTSGSASNARLELEGGITITGEPLAINGAGNYFGALSSTSGNNIWEGNVTIGSAGTRLGATTGNTLTVSGIIDSGSVETGLIIRTQDLASKVILSGPNTYLGDTSVLIGKLQLDGGNNRLPVTTRLSMGSSGTNPDAEFDLNGRNQQVAGLVLTGTASKNSVNNSSPTLSTLTVNTEVPSSFDAILKGNLALVKTGPGILALSGPNTFTGSTRIEQGVLTSGANDTLPVTTDFSLGSGATTGDFDLANFNQTVASLSVLSDGPGFNTITIGSGRALTVAGNFTVGFNSAANTTTRLSATGQGTLALTGGNFQLGGSTTSAVGNAATLDLSGLAGFAYSNTAGTFRVGDAANSNSGGTGGSTLILAATSNITAQLFTMNSPTAVPHVVRLGSGTNSIHADTVQIGVASNRSGGSLDFNTPTGTLRIRDTTGNGRANMTVGYGNAGTAVVSTNTVDLSGHSADLLLGTLQIAGRTGSQGGGLTSSFAFDSGVLDVTGLTLGDRRGTSGNTGAVTGTLNLGGGSVSIGNSGLIVASNTSSLAANSVTATVNISGGVVNIGASGGTSISLGSSNNSANGGATATLSITGGMLTVGGDIKKGSVAGTVNSTLNLSGGTLDLGGHALGAAGPGAITLNAESGTLRNVASINGTGGLTKTTSGTLVLDGMNTYTGNTVVNEGTLVLAENARLTFVLGAASGSNNRILGAGTVILNGDFEIDTSAVDASTLTTGTWTLVDASTLTETFGSTFNIPGAGWSENADVWTKTTGTRQYTFKEADGILTMGPLASYANWITDFFPGENDPAIIGADRDPDHDGIANGVEMVIGGNPATGMDVALLPTLEMVNADPDGDTNFSDYFLFTYRRTALSEIAGVEAECEIDTDLAGPWTPAAAGVAGVVIVEEFDFNFSPPAPPDTDRVRVHVPRGSNDSLFGRLNVLVPAR